MKFSEDSSGVLHLNSTSNKAVKEYDCQKVGIKHSSVGDVCDVVVSQKNINESKESSSDRQMTFTSAGSHSNHSNLHSSSEYPQKARRSLLDWDSFINLPKKPRNLSLKTDDLSRTLVTKTTDSRSPIKSKQEGDSRASPCLSPIKANEFVGNVKLAPLRCSTEHDKLLTNGGYSSSEEHHSKSVPARGGESSDFSSPDFTLSSIPVKNRAETRKRRSSHFATASNDSEVSSDQLDIHSQRQNQKKIIIGNHNSKKRKLSPSVRIRRTKDTFTCIAKENLHNGVQSPDFAFDTGNSVHCQKVSCRSLCGACDHDNHISNELNLRELSGNIASQQNHSLANNSFTTTHVATQRPSLRLKKSPKLPKEELISTQNQSNLANKSVFQCLYCTRPFSEKRYRLKHMIACRLAPKNLTKKKLHEIGRMYESSSISSGSPNLVNNVDEEISISNGVICQANQTLQNGHSDEIENTIKKDKNSPENSYQNNPKMNHDVDSKSNPITPFLSTTTNPFINSDDSLKTDRNTLTTNTFDSHLVTKRSENNLSSNNNEPYESDENIWQNYRPSYSGPYTCSFCYRVIHNRSNFSRHIASCKARISLSTRSTPKPKPAVRRNKREFHFVFTPTHKVTPQLKNLRKELFKGGISNTELNKVDHQHSNGDTDNNEIAMNSGDKSLDPCGLSTLDKNVTALVNSEDSQHDCTDEHLFSTGCHQDNPTEDEQRNRMSPSTSGLETSEEATTTTTATTTMTTTTTTGTSSEQDVSNENLTDTPFKCNMCSLSYRHRTSLLRHARQSNHKVDLIRTRKRTDYVKNNNSGIRKSGECLNGGGCMDNEMVSNSTWKECSESVTLDSKVVENENIGQVVGEVDHQHSNGDTDNNEIAMNSGDKSLDPCGLSTLDKNVTALVNSEDSQHDCTDEHLFSTGCHQDNPTEVDLIRTRKRTDYVKNNNSGIRKSGECLNGGGCMDNEMVSNSTWKECSESVTLDSKVVENENIGQVVGEMKQISETHSSSNNLSILTGKTYSLGLRSRRLSLQSNQSIRNIETPSIISKLNRRKNRSVSPYSLRHPRIEEEISKCSRRSSVSTQSLSDNLIDDVKSVISNATTVPASDCSLKINESSSLFTCSWCNRSGFKCWRYLQIHRARCSSHPNRSNKQKSILSTNNISQVKTSVICEQCNREFRSGTGLKVHQTLMSHHNNKSFIHKNELSNNLLSQSIACPGCSHDSPLFESTEKLLKHLLTLKSTNTTTNTNHHHHHHTNRSQYWPTVLSVPNLGYGCHICGMLLASESRLDKHKKAVHEVWLFQEQQNISPSKKLS
ncbi:unnamed protein product [Schistosoma intercalatum]|nr:unnamed protein product [Schistosoma intercalatum]CAH8450085.1 unnamed protein product [Schistosoma intercalatum]CAH8450117.1 unnamed protein product [Schistosoma intercalatum]